MRLSWKELSVILADILQNHSYTHLTSVIENIQILSKSYHDTQNSNMQKIDSCSQELLVLLTNESIAMKDLTPQIQLLKQHIDYDSFSRKPLMHQQRWLYQRMAALGYKTQSLGECYGISCMAIQAFWANDIQTFNQRLQIIYDMPIADFTHLNEIKEPQTREGKEKLMDLHAFFDGITLHQRPDIYLHDDDLQPLSKRKDITPKICIPLDFLFHTKHILFLGEKDTLSLILCEVYTQFNEFRSSNLQCH